MVLFSSLLVIGLALVVALAIAAAGSSTQFGPIDRELAKRPLRDIARPAMVSPIISAPSGATPSALKISSPPSAPLIFAAGLQ
jgi:hypothetical protein